MDEIQFFNGTALFHIMQGPQLPYRFADVPVKPVGGAVLGPCGPVKLEPLPTPPGRQRGALLGNNGAS